MTSTCHTLYSHDSFVFSMDFLMKKLVFFTVLLIVGIVHATPVYTKCYDAEQHLDVSAYMDGNALMIGDSSMPLGRYVAIPFAVGQIVDYADGTYLVIAKWEELTDYGVNVNHSKSISELRLSTHYGFAFESHDDFLSLKYHLADITDSLGKKSLKLVFVYNEAGVDNLSKEVVLKGQALNQFILGLNGRGRMIEAGFGDNSDKTTLEDFAYGFVLSHDSKAWCEFIR